MRVKKKAKENSLPFSSRDYSHNCCITFGFFVPVKYTFINILSGPIRLLSFPIREAKKILYYHRTFDEYRRLKKEVDVLKARFVGFEEVLLENTRLEKLLEFKRKLIYSSVAASVVGRDPSRWNSSLIVDKGTKDGIEEGAPVVDALGVVGKVVEVGASKSKVILLTDPQFSVAASVQRPRESGLVSGTLKGNVCRLKYFDPHVEIRVGDQVVTSKLSESFPESILVGEVVYVEEQPNDDGRECLIRPAVNFSQIEEVLIIRK